MSFKIETIKVPTNSSMYPFDELEVEENNSFFVPGRKSCNFGSTVTNAKRRPSNKGKEFMTETRTEKGVSGVRVWRIK